MRHTYATHLLNAGAERVDIKALLGHESIATTPMDTHRRAGADGAGGWHGCEDGQSAWQKNKKLSVRRYMAEKTGLGDRITNRTAALSALILGMTALVNSVSDLFGKLREKWEILQQLPGWSRWGITAFLVIIVFYLIRVGFASQSRLLRPERFLIQPDEPRFLKGREREVQELGQLCGREPLVFFDGESGCGKSALVSAGLLPWCKSDPVRPLPLRIDLSGASWDNGIADLLGRTLWIEQGDLCRELHFIEYPQADAVFGVLIQIGRHTARMPLLIFDQFDDYQTAYREHFYPVGGSRLLTSQEFLASNHLG